MKCIRSSGAGWWTDYFTVKKRDFSVLYYTKTDQIDTLQWEGCDDRQEPPICVAGSVVAGEPEDYRRCTAGPPASYSTYYGDHRTVRELNPGSDCLLNGSTTVQD